MIRFENVTKQYDNGTYAVKPLNMEIGQGELFVIIGPSGSGKTTTLKMINRLISMSSGDILIEEKRINDYIIDELRWDIGYVLQDIALFPHMTIEENISVVPELKKWDKSKIRRRVSELLEMVGLSPDEYRMRKPNQLSGGEQQRIGVIRALAVDPKMILMDEPFSALDPISRTKLQDDIIKLHRSINKTIVFVTHDMQEALKLATRICVMKDGEVQQIGTPDEIMNQPANQFVANFVGKPKELSNNMNMINLEQALQTVMDSELTADLSNAIPSQTDFKSIVNLLAQSETLPVEKDGKNNRLY